MTYPPTVPVNSLPVNSGPVNQPTNQSNPLDSLPQSIGVGQPTVLRILDANLDRAREGLRIIEEWCRFGLNQAQFTEECKQLRQELGQWHREEIRSARDTPNDPGTELTHPNEQQRANITELLRSNFCRTQEALRVLEEYGKLYSEPMATACKQMRYRVYTLESNLTGHQRHQKLKQSYLYLVTSPVDNLLAVVEAALQGGLTLVQYRDKTADDLTRISTATRLRQLCHRYNALFIINDRVDLALAVEADGVHLGQTDVPIALARQLLGSQRIIGRSTTNPEEMQRAIEEGADYIGVGPVYETPTKAGRAAAGLEYVRYAVKHATVPWFAIGGINAENLAEVLSAGAERIAVVRAIMEAEQPTLMTQFFVSQMQRVQTIRAVK
ncbi:thiamine phosphate synthase [Leptolyngbya sp. NK1-12]|uniref:Thiamine-phosphate synthase n=2 Tax=Leptolyngbya sp. NK1-12 TaxID=2547451 RepID=A0AA96WPA6_9CYAN|nr:thiamine phosphate synthase [Leptolyngbya sp. NK1-12]